jgi:putative heme-binding domain-containing protein
MPLSAIARHLGLALLLASPLPAQERPRAADTGDYVYIPGQGPRRLDGTVPSKPDAQFRQALDNVKAVLESAGLALTNVVYVQVYLTDIGSYSEMNRVFAEYFPKTPPARAVLGVYALPDPPVQIGAVAVRNLDGRKAIRPLDSGDESASPGILTHDRLFISSMAGTDPVSGKAPEDPAAQVDLALDRMQAVVKAAGLELSHVVFVNPYLTSGIPSRVMNERYARRFEFGNTPARATIQVSSLPGGAHIEYTGVAVRDLQQRKAVRPKNMPPSPTASPCVFAGDTLYCSAKSGFIPGPHGGVYAATTPHQLRQTMRNLLDNLEEAGMDLGQVVATNVYLDDLADAPTFGDVYRQYFGPMMPAMTTVQQMAPTERKPDPEGHYPDLEQVSLIAVRGNASAAGRRAFESSCAPCHGLNGRGGERGPDVATKPEIARLSDGETLEVLRDGVPQQGMPPFATLGPARLSDILSYLRFLQGKRTAPLVAASAERGKELFTGKGGCSECHRVHGAGGFLGPDLSEYGANHSADDIRSAMVSADKRPALRKGLAKATTREGRQIRGLVRNEDNFSVQLQALDGTFYLLERSGLSGIAFDPSPVMPDDYGRKLSKGELDQLAEYLLEQR